MVIRILVSSYPLHFVYIQSFRFGDTTLPISKFLSRSKYRSIIQSKMKYNNVYKWKIHTRTYRSYTLVHTKHNTQLPSVSVSAQNKMYKLFRKPIRDLIKERQPSGIVIVTLFHTLPHSHFYSFSISLAGFSIWLSRTYHTNAIYRYIIRKSFRLKNIQQWPKKRKTRKAGRNRRRTREMEIEQILENKI